MACKGSSELHHLYINYVSIKLGEREPVSDPVELEMGQVQNDDKQYIIGPEIEDVNSSSTT